MQTLCLAFHILHYDIVEFLVMNQTVCLGKRRLVWQIQYNIDPSVRKDKSK